MTRQGARAALTVKLLVALTVFAGACETTADREGQGVHAVQFQDVVVPTGFRLQDQAHESHSREEANWRQGHFVYSGPTGLEEALGYVKQRMPQHSWRIVAEEAVGETGKRLLFERGIYSAEYTFQRRDGSTQMVVVYTTDYSRR